LTFELASCLLQHDAHDAVEHEQGPDDTGLPRAFFDAAKISIAAVDDIPVGLDSKEFGNWL